MVAPVTVADAATVHGQTNPNAPTQASVYNGVGTIEGVSARTLVTLAGGELAVIGARRVDHADAVDYGFGALGIEYLLTTNDGMVIPDVAGIARIPVLANDSAGGAAPGDDIDTTSIAITVKPTHGAAAASGGFAWYAAHAAYAGSDSFTYTVASIGGTTGTARAVAVTVTAAAVATINPISVRSARGATLTIAPSLAVAPGVVVQAVQVTTAALQGVASVVGREVSYVAAEDFVGVDVFSWRFLIDGLWTSPGLVSVSTGQKLRRQLDGFRYPKSLLRNDGVVNPVDPLAALGDIVITGYRTPLLIQPLLNDIGNNLRIISVTLSDLFTGSVDITDVDQTLTYSPADEFTGIEEFLYTISDGIRTSTAQISVTVLSPELLAVEDAAATETTTPVVISPLDNDIGADLEVTAVANPAGGSASITDGGITVTYTADAGFSGIDEFLYTITDGALQTSSALIRVEVIPPPLSIVGNTAHTTTTTPVIIPALANDVGSNLEIIAVENPAGGSAVITDSGTTVTYTADALFAGVDIFAYTAQDDYGQMGSAQITVTVAGPAISASDDTVTTPAQTAIVISVRANDSGSNLLVTAVTNPPNGSATISGAGTTVTYTPDALFAGSDSFSYTVTDDYGQSASASVAVTVTSPPILAVDDSGTTPAVTMIPLDVLSNDVGQGLKVTSISVPAHGTATIPTGGLIIRYTPAAGFAGTEVLTYGITDAFGQTDTGLVTITVTPPTIAIVGNNASTVTTSPVIIPVLANDVGVGLEVTSVSNPPGGTATISGSGTTVTYVADGGFVGTDTFTYTATDDYGQMGSASVTVTVNAAPVPVDAVNDSISANAGVTRTISPLANDIGTGLSIVAVGVPSAGGTVTRINANTQLSYTPLVSFSGLETISYTAGNGVGSDTAIISVTVIAAPALVDAINDSAVATSGVAKTISPLSNDVGTGLTISAVGAPSQGGSAVRINSNTQVSYTPLASFSGTETFSYTATDGVSSDTATVTVTVSRPPVDAINDAVTAVAGVAKTLSPLANDLGTGLTITAIGARSNGGAASLITANTQIQYTPDLAFVGTETFTYTISDGATSDTATISATVSAPPSTVDAVNDTATAVAGVAKTISPLANDLGTGLTISVLGTPSQGGSAVRINSNTQVSYTPLLTFAGVETISYTATDGVNSDTATISITVTAPPFAAVDDTASTPTTIPITIFPLANDTGVGLTLTRIGVVSDTVEVSNDDVGTVPFSPSNPFNYLSTHHRPLGANITFGVPPATSNARVTTPVYSGSKAGRGRLANLGQLTLGVQDKPVYPVASTDNTITVTKRAGSDPATGHNLPQTIRSPASPNPPFPSGSGDNELQFYPHNGGAADILDQFFQFTQTGPNTYIASSYDAYPIKGTDVYEDTSIPTGSGASKLRFPTSVLLGIEINDAAPGPMRHRLQGVSTRHSTKVGDPAPVTAHILSPLFCWGAYGKDKFHIDPPDPLADNQGDIPYGAVLTLTTAQWTNERNRAGITNRQRVVLDCIYYFGIQLTDGHGDHVPNPTPGDGRGAELGQIRIREDGQMTNAARTDVDGLLARLHDLLVIVRNPRTHKLESEIFNSPGNPGHGLPFCGGGGPRDTTPGNVERWRNTAHDAPNGGI